MPSKSKLSRSDVSHDAKPSADGEHAVSTESDSSLAESKANSAESQPPIRPESTTEPDVQSPTKMALAIAVYRRMSRKKNATRKEIVAAFVDEVGLTKNGAATYFQMIKKSHRKG